MLSRILSRQIAAFLLGIHTRPDDAYRILPSVWISGSNSTLASLAALQALLLLLYLCILKSRQVDGQAAAMGIKGEPDAYISEQSEA